ncbi:DUF1178 family protein [Hyphomicrobium sulfonivorans]|uniref:DUF1178 family protein n=1 Tax=Hyphomicrobium sulfonivorans TaxID=121290 RepID=UPI00156FA099|nr:DUF1178 family protein [Hyphomicrobium sulfonivorans]NSL70793.1 DUF1178 domain-containing protein [Hyphomicrobium sulfonivorans]
MIRYSLRCAGDHEFEAWFASSASYDAQAAAGDVVCPVCASRKVEKSIMAPNVAVSGRSAEMPSPNEDTAAKVRALMREVRQMVEAQSENVGDRFPDEARAIHYREVEQRAIRGTASADEVRSLLEEGIAIVPLPDLPEEAN